MKVVVDTSVWSLALRRRTSVASPFTNLLQDLIEDGRVVLLGVVRQELLSGIRHDEQFERLQIALQAFPDPEFETEDFEKAAAFYNTCRRSGIQGSSVDFLISAYAHRRKFHILTTDPDFQHFSAHIPISLLIEPPFK